MKVGLIGLGNMGRPMAGRLTAAGFRLAVWNRSAGRAAAAAAGATVAASPRELAAASDVVITMLADGAAVRAVLGGADGVLTAARAGTIVIDMSTIGPVLARDLAAEAAAHDVAFLDAPVSGSVALAEQGTLTAMVGGPPDAVERARPVLAALTKAQFHLGPAGAGAAMKLAVNILIAASNQAIAEALTLAESAGIGRADAYDVLAASAVASPFISYKREAFLHPDTAPVAFAAALMRKDLELALSVAAPAGLPLPVASAARDYLDAACAAGYSDADFACVAELLRHHRPLT
jgi:3-hydroxyisobutyrate dehydrogenase-like beta-hydroxyacid dehydrogenase